MPPLTHRSKVASVLYGLALLVAIAPSPSPSTAAGGSQGGGVGITQPGSLVGGQASTGQNVQAGQTIAAQHGWTGGQFQCLNWLWTRESGWSQNATNSQSGAYGIAQSLHGDSGGQGGNEYNASDPEGLTAAQLQAANDGSPGWQMEWGANYIQANYGSPCNAWGHETSHGWY